MVLENLVNILITAPSHYLNLYPYITSIDLARNGNSGCASDISGCANATSEGNPYENEIIGVNLGCAISFIVCAKHGARVAG